MFGVRYTAISALMLGLGTIQYCSGPLRADEPALVSRFNAPSNSVIDERGFRNATRVWPSNRQVLPNLYAGGIHQTPFLEFEPIAVSFQEDGSSTQDSNDGNTADEEDLNLPAQESNDENTADNEEPNLAARVRELEQEVAKLTSSEGSDADGSVTTRLDRLEETLVDFEVDGSEFMETLARTSRRIVNGRIHLDTWENTRSTPGINAIETGDFTKDPEDRLLVRRARIGVRGTVPPDNMSYRLELEFSGRDGGRIRDAWLAWDDLPFLYTVRVGNQKRPYGLDHLNSSNFMTFLERPFVVDALNRGNRRVGFASYGGTDDQAWNWQAGLFNMVQIQDTNDIVGDNAQVEFAGRLAHVPWYDNGSNGRGYAHIGLAGTLAFPDGATDENQAQFRTQPEAATNADWLDTGQVNGANSYQLCALESVFNVGALNITGEWMQVWMQRNAGFGDDLYFNGGYVSISYFLTGEHIPWNRKVGMMGRVSPIENFFCVRNRDGSYGKGLGAWQVALRLSRADFNDKDIRGGVGQSATLALNWHWNANTRLQFNYIFGQIEDRRTTLTSGPTPIVSGDYQIIGTRFMIDF